MQIKLNDKTYKTKVIKAKIVRKSIEISETVNLDKLSTSDLDRLVEFIVEVFDNQFTVDDIYEGLDAKDLVPSLLKAMGEVNGGIEEEFSKVPEKK